MATERVTGIPPFCICPDNDYEGCIAGEVHVVHGKNYKCPCDKHPTDQHLEGVAS